MFQGSNAAAVDFVCVIFRVVLCQETYLLGSLWLWLCMNEGQILLELGIFQKMQNQWAVISSLTSCHLVRQNEFNLTKY